MSMCHGKRNSYTTDFKLKVLEYYLKNGGENVFGLKSRTAEHFNIGKKTVVRIVENRNALLRTKASKSKKSVEGATKSASNSKVVSASKKSPTAGGSSRGSIAAVKPMPSHGSKASVLPVKMTGKVGVKNVANVPAKKESKKEAAPAEVTVAKSATPPPRESEDRKRPADLKSEQEEVLDLPEDPDYAILKVPIEGGSTGAGVAGPALLLSTATDEVRRALVYECEVLYECKVCRSLFRSVVNFLAHKRIFCTLSHNSNNTFYHEGETSRLTPHSGTLISTGPVEGGNGRISTRNTPQDSAAVTTASPAVKAGSCDTDTDSPVANADSSIKNSNFSITSADSSVINTESSVINTDPSVISTDSSVINNDSSVINTGSSNSNTGSSNSNTCSPSINTDSSITNTESDIINTDSSGFSSGSSASNTGSPSTGARPPTTNTSLAFSASSATNTGSSAYYGRLESLERGRAAASRDCRLQLESSGVSSAVYQTFVYPGAPPQQPSLQNARLTVREHEQGVMAVLDEDGKIVSTVSLDGQNLSSLPRTDKTSVLSSSNVDVDVKEEPAEASEIEEVIDVDEKEEKELCEKSTTDQHPKTTFHRNRKAKTQIEYLRQAVKNTPHKGKDARGVENWSRASEGSDEASSSGSDVVIKMETNDSNSTRTVTRLKRGECGGGGDGGFAKRWMCNVCGKLYVTHTASLAHAATHSDSSFLPKPQLVDVHISRKTFNQVVSNRIGADPTKSTVDVSMTEGPKGVNKPRLPTDDDPVIISKKTSGQVGGDEASSSNKSTLELTDVAAFNILKNNNMRYREEAFPFQSIDQRGALEKSIKKIYDRHKSMTSEPRPYQVLLQTRQTVKKLGLQTQKTDSGTRESFSKNNILPSSSSDLFAGDHRRNAQAVTGANKRKLNSTTAYVDGKNEFESPYRRKRDQTPHSQSSFMPSNFSSTKIIASESNGERYDRFNSSVGSPISTYPSKANSENFAIDKNRAVAFITVDSKSFQSKKVDSGELRKNHVPASEHLQASISEPLSSIANDKPRKSVPQLSEVTACKSHTSESPSSLTTRASTTSGTEFNSQASKVMHCVSAMGHVSAPPCATQLPEDASTKNTSNAWNLYEEDWADEEEEVELLIPDGTSANGDVRSSENTMKPDESASRGVGNGSQKVPIQTESINEKMGVQLNSASKRAKPSPLSYNACGSSSKSDTTETVMSTSSSCPVTNKTSGALFFETNSAGDHTSSKDLFIESSQVVGKNGDESTEKVSSVKGSYSDAQHSKNLHTMSFISKERKLQLQCTSSKETSLNLFDCGSMAEQELEEERHMSKGHPFSDLLPAGPSQSARDDTLMQEASSLGLFDTGFEECRLHSDRLDDETLSSPREQSPVAGPSYR